MFFSVSKLLSRWFVFNGKFARDKHSNCVYSDGCEWILVLRWIWSVVHDVEVILGGFGHHKCIYIAKLADLIGGN